MPAPAKNSPPETPADTTSPDAAPAKDTPPAPAKAPVKDTAPAKDTPEAAPAKAEPDEPDVPAGRLPAGVYEFTGDYPTQYLEVPLTARPADPGTPARPADGDQPEIPEVPATPATVFHWEFSAPDDGRWRPTTTEPNQLPDNAPAPDPED